MTGGFEKERVGGGGVGGEGGETGIEITGMDGGDGDVVDGVNTEGASLVDENGGRHIKEVDSMGEYEECVEEL